MAESLGHRRLVLALIAKMRSAGITITHVAGDAAFPDPPRVGRHEPDVVGHKHGVRYFGEAKTGAGDLRTSRAFEQFDDFSHRRSRTGHRPFCPFILCVPRGATREAARALADAGARPGSTVIVSPTVVRRRRAA